MNSDLAQDVSLPQSHFPAITQALRDKGWIVIPDFATGSTSESLYNRAIDLGENFSSAAIGRGEAQQENHQIRTDSTFWLDPDNVIDSSWLGLMEQLRLALNRTLFLGLFEYESHYACFAPGDFYRRHLDAFQGEGKRMVSVVLYLNHAWQPADGGEFVIYPGGEVEGTMGFLPNAGTLAVFLSEEFPHEVLAASRTRYSIAGWFRVNGTTGQRVDPAA